MSPPRDIPDPVDRIAAAWLEERPGTPVESIGVVTRIAWISKLMGEDRRRVLAGSGADIATLDLLSVLRRSGPPYQLTTRELARRISVTPGAITQRVTRAERDGLVERAPGGGRTVLVRLTPAGHARVEGLVDGVLGREADLLSALTPEQRSTLAELLRVLLDDLRARVGSGERVPQVGDALFEQYGEDTGNRG